ncbi:MAG: hypothetical protein ACRYFU_16225 [Janthinobacterium lividum]
MTRTVVICFLGILWAPASTSGMQQTDVPAAVPTIILRAGIIHNVASSPVSSTSNECDGRGYVFFELYEASRMFSENAILRSSEDGKEVRSFSFPNDLGKRGDWHYSVDGAGGLYVTHSELDNHVLVHLSTTGEVSRTKLELPAYFYVHSFAVLPDGRSMFVGSMPSSQTASEYTESPVSIWLDPSGKIVQKTSPGRPFSVSLTPFDGFVVPGMPGTFVEAGSSEIKIFGARGDLIETLPVVKPTKDSFASGLQFVDGTIAIVFQHPAGAGSFEPKGTSKAEGSSTPYVGPLEQIWLLENPITGQNEAYYKMPKDFLGSALCYLGHQGFLYLTMKDKRASLVEAAE